MRSTVGVHSSHFSSRKDHHQKHLLCTHLWQLQKKVHSGIGSGTPCSILKSLCFSYQGKRTHVFLHQSSGWMLNCAVVKGFHLLSICLLLLFPKLQFVLVRTCCSVHYGTVLRDKWIAWWRESISHFLPNKKRVWSENPFSDSPCPKCLT